MANSITIQLRPTKSYSAPSVANLFHNTGLAKATYWIKESNNIKSNLDIKNLTTREAVSLWRKWEEEAINLVIKNKGKKPQKKQILVEEGLMVIGKDVLKKNSETFIQIFLEFKKWFEEKYKTEILAHFFHNHEGHLDENGNFLSNLHIHFFFINVDKKGESVRRQIKKTDLSYFQTKIHEIGQKYIPTLKRATNYAELGLKAPKHKSHRKFRTQKNKETQLKLALVKDLKEENKLLREELKKLGAQREDYAKLEDLVKELKKKIKQKDLTIAEMIAELEKYKQKVYSKYKYKDTDEPVPYSELAEYYKNRLNKASQKQKELLDRIKYLEDENGALKASKSDLEEENKKLKEEKSYLEEEIKKLKSFIMQNYRAEITCKTCRRVTEHNPYVVVKLKKEGLIEEYKQENGRMFVKTKEFELEEKEDKKSFQVKVDKSELSEEEIEKAILLIMELRGWSINDIVPRGSDNFVEKAKKVIEKLKDEIEYKDNLVMKKRKFKF